MTKETAETRMDCQGYVMRKLSRVLCLHAVMLAHISKAGMHTENIISAPTNLAIYASSFLILYSESLGKAPFLVLYGSTAGCFCSYAQSQPWAVGAAIGTALMVHLSGVVEISFFSTFF